MTIVLVFDHGIDLEALKEKTGAWRDSRILLFPLTSQWNRIRAVEEICRSVAGAEVKLAESAKLIDDEVSLLRERISKWSAELGERKIGRRSIKEWFLLPKGEVSTWWFSILAEKNPIKTDIFFNIAQLNAIDKVISKAAFDDCAVSIGRENVLKAVEGIAKRYGVKTSRASQAGYSVTFKKRIKSHLAANSVPMSIVRAIMNLRVTIAGIATIKRTMGPVTKRLNETGGSILFVSYFPLVDKESAARGELKNRYAIPLQEKIKQMNRKIVWIWVYAPLDGYSLKDAARLAAEFTARGEKNFFIDEFSSAGMLFGSLLLWLRQVVDFIRLNRRMPDRFLYENVTVPEAAGLLRGLMADSFAGWTGLSNIIYLGFYKNLFSNFHSASHCIYCFEMHAWEKALNAAKQLKSPHLKTVAFQHSFVPVNYFPYFCHLSEIAGRRNQLSLPMPDILTCNGDIPFDRMSGSGYSNLRKVEAIRYSYLLSYLESPEFLRKEKVVLVACPLMRDKTKALISLFYETFPRPEGFKVWLKGHPALPLENILEELGISAHNFGYVIKHEPISELLKAAGIVFTGGSSVVLEALASGCRVILPVFADCIFVNPLDEFDRFYVKVNNPDDLRRAVRDFMEGSGHKNDKRDIDKFISSYWCLDRSLQRWEGVLTE